MQSNVKVGVNNFAMGDSVVFLFTVSTLTSVLCLIVVFLASWHYETMFLELATSVSHQEQNMIKFKGTGTGISANDNNSLKGAGSVKGVTFTRWGYSECPQMTELVYNGQMVDFLSSGSTPLCLPLNPTYPSELDRIQRQEVIQKGDERNYSAPCAVCYSKNHSTVLMQPARHICTSGWSMLYEGLLVSNKASLLCMDNALLQESSTRTINVYHYVKASCDLLPCPPYDDTTSLTCAVCIK